ncbi:MAG TPA: hypothetical protein VFW94_13875 [Candidatus Acidoferrales bacterium]|nr:hypothetical protein [Candidatus Acidoferrales bacterium]
MLAWTAFEVLASDLWVAAVNLQPNPLAVRFSQSLQDKAQGKSVTVSSLAAYGDHDFNLSNLMGEVLRDKADFASLQTTRAAYERTFGTDVPAFTSPNLRLLELVRNLILHKAGIVDSVFLKALRDKAIKVSHPDLSTLEGGQQLPITRSLAAALIDSAVDSGIAIMEFVLNHFWPPNDHKKPSNSSE